MQKSTVNSEAGMKARLEFAKKLESLVFDPDQNVLIFIDEMPFYLAMHRSHGWSRNADNRMLEKIENFAPLREFLVEHGGSISILRTSPNSPHLNLCEYYNRVLRTYSQHERNDAVISSLLLAEDAPHGQKTMLAKLEAEQGSRTPTLVA
ncbi:Hypothetical Protein FCC1311_049932 [Hondaea fermentalgiana]|uniref:Uncharacterized protein n=1 Tax=Hondaea fermentalgiana TaxID=2315210 RepID=A0A2R5GCS5_9STRA|nr:Hypothetical Protein FCC1311_049932 [Hondaea fermentalgiana]|eukprot:GBG28772.1 Hypothetical Protein FCC1311_049932 [Hondaea fermentalgiana]